MHQERAQDDPYVLWNSYLQNGILNHYVSLVGTIDKFGL